MTDDALEVKNEQTVEENTVEKSPKESVKAKGKSMPSKKKQAKKVVKVEQDSEDDDTARELDEDIEQEVAKLSDEETQRRIQELKPIVEGALLAAGEALKLSRLQSLFDPEGMPSKGLLIQTLEVLQEDFTGRGFSLVEVASGWRFQVQERVAPWVNRLWDEKPQKYSRALLETLALIAYRQPLTRGDIEEVRGVAVSSHIIKTLVEREWVKVVGHRDVPGRPSLYASTRQFLDYFGLKSLEELPTLGELKDIDGLNATLDLDQKLEAVVAEANGENLGNDIPDEQIISESVSSEMDDTQDPHAVDVELNDHKDETSVEGEASDGLEFVGDAIEGFKPEAETEEKTEDDLLQAMLSDEANVERVDSGKKDEEFGKNTLEQDGSGLKSLFEQATHLGDDDNEK